MEQLLQAINFSLDLLSENRSQQIRQNGLSLLSLELLIYRSFAFLLSLPPLLVVDLRLRTFFGRPSLCLALTSFALFFFSFVFFFSSSASLYGLLVRICDLDPDDMLRLLPYIFGSGDVSLILTAYELCRTPKPLMMMSLIRVYCSSSSTRVSSTEIFLSFSMIRFFNLMW